MFVVILVAAGGIFFQFKNNASKKQMEEGLAMTPQNPLIICVPTGPGTQQQPYGNQSLSDTTTQSI